MPVALAGRLRSLITTALPPTLQFRNLAPASVRLAFAVTASSRQQAKAFRHRQRSIEFVARVFCGGPGFDGAGGPQLQSARYWLFCWRSQSAVISLPAPPSAPRLMV